MKPIASLCLALMLFAAPAVVAEPPTVYYQEDFRNYRDVPPSVADGVDAEIGNDPIWSGRADATFRPKASGLVFGQFLPTADTIPLDKSFDVLFDFRLLPVETAGLSLHLRGQHEGTTGQLVVSIQPERIRVTTEGLGQSIDKTATLPEPLAMRDWHRFAMTVRDGAVQVYISQDHRLERVAEVRTPAVAFAGVNFAGEAGGAFSVTDIVVRDAAPLPEQSITRLLPTLQDDASTYRMGSAQPSMNVPANDVFGATVRTGTSPKGVRMTVNWADGHQDEIAFTVAGTRAKHKPIDLTDAMIEVVGVEGSRGKLEYCIRPRLRRYHTSYSYTDVYHDVVRDWDLLPKASSYPVTVEFRRRAGGVDLYLNGRFVSGLDGGPVQGVSFTLAPDAGIKDVISRAGVVDDLRYLPLDIAALRGAKAFANTTPSLTPGETVVASIPMRVASGAGSADVGRTRQGQGNWALEVDEYLARSAFDGFLTEVHLAVPSAPYHRAWVLVAVDPDPAKDPVFTTRLTAYQENGIGSNRIADTVTHLPRGGENLPEHVKRVGSVTGKDAQGRAVDVPLYLVEVPLKTGRILDVVEESSALDFEFFGKPWSNFEQLDKTSKPDPSSTSAVQVFGVTLEKSPVNLDFVQAQPANVFHNDEQRKTTVVVRSLAAAQGELAWEIRDADGTTVDQGSSPLRFSGAGQKATVDISLDMPELGWYELLISARDSGGHVWLKHPARFALLGQDHRRATYDSPYGTWWFDGAHLTPSDLDFAGPVMFKAGIRKATWTKQSEAAMSKWSITKQQVNMPFRMNDLKDPEKAKQRARKEIDQALANYPHLSEVVVFHESGPGNDLPVELIGLKPEQTEAQARLEQRYADLYNLAGAFFRENYPHLKLVVGNNSASQAVMAAVFRHGGDPSYIDAIGMEAPSQVIIPEKLQEWGLQGHHIASDTTEILTGRRVPATGCYEFTYRSERDMGEHQQAQWYARDMLISLANGFTRIGPGILFDTSTAYYNGLWGSSGLLQRGPYGYPKKAYVAYATLTNVLDQVTLRREVPTGSPTIYALDFKRSDGKHVLAIWAARGEADFVIEYQGDTQSKVIDLYGRSRDTSTQDKRLIVQTGASPAYVVADQPVASITIGKRRFPQDMARAERATVAASLDDASSVELIEDHSLDTPRHAPLQTPIRQAGRFHLRQVHDDVRGDAIELELDTSHQPELSKYITEYATLMLRKPALVDGEPAALGVWVKGNSNWGRVMFEVKDAEGEVWRSVGTSGWGCDILDWPGHIAVNFDGWNFVALPLRETTLFNDHSPGPVLEQWVSGGGNKRIDYPIQVTGLIVEMNRTPLRLTDFTEVPPVIRLQGISEITEPQP